MREVWIINNNTDSTITIDGVNPIAAQDSVEVIGVISKEKVAQSDIVKEYLEDGSIDITIVTDGVTDFVVNADNSDALLTVRRGYSGELGATYSFDITTLSISSGSVSIDTSEAISFSIILTQDITLNKPTGGTDGQTIRIRVIQDGTGGHDITPASGWNFGTEIAEFDLETTASSVSYISAIYRESANVWDVVSVLNGY